jgi:tRNA nucleotidyltransferase/poly(A) polymerase
MAKSTLPKKPHESPRQAAVAVLRKLQEYGHVAYFAGGCVRDALLGLEPKDYDVATDATPDRVKLLFPKSRLVGEAFGVVRVHMMGIDIEVATFRLEWGYTDGRRPGKVHFTDAQHDAQRRDFTINGLFENPMAKRKADRIIDYVGGQRDLKERVVRAIGDPVARFEEDYLRMLRAVRFAARMGFHLDSKTAAAIPPLAMNLDAISRERVGQEVQLMLTAETASKRSAAIGLIQRLELDAPVLGEEHFDATMPVAANLPDGAAYPTVLAAWMLDRHLRPDDVADSIDAMGQRLRAFVDGPLDLTVRTWRGAMCLSNEHRDDLRQLVVLLARACEWAEMSVARRKRLLAEPLWDQALTLLKAMRQGPGGSQLPGGSAHASWPCVPGGGWWAGATRLVALIEQDAAALEADGVAPEPFVSGDDLIRLGRKPGPDFRRLLEEVYDAQLEGRVASRDDALELLKRQV